VKTLFNSY